MFAGINYKLNFGKYKGKLLGQVVKSDPQYVLWLDEEDVLMVDPVIIRTCEDKCKDKDFYDLTGEGYSWYDKD
jgi:hypothetical protein